MIISVKRSRREAKDKEAERATAEGGRDWREMALAIHRRYLQVYATCYCEVNRLSSVRKRGSCYAAYKVGGNREQSSRVVGWRDRCERTSRLL